MYKTGFYYIWLLFTDRYPEFSFPTEPTHPEELQEYLEDLKETLSDQINNSAPSLKEAISHYEKLRSEKPDKIENLSIKLLEKRHPLNCGVHLISPEIEEHWLSTNSLAPEEAVALFLRRNPARIHELVSEEASLGIVRVQQKYEATLNSILKYIEPNTERISTQDYLKWKASYVQGSPSSSIQKTKQTKAGRPLKYFSELTLLIFLKKSVDRMEPSSREQFETYLSELQFSKLLESNGAERQSSIKNLWPDDNGVNDIIRKMYSIEVDLSELTTVKTNEFIYQVEGGFGSANLLNSHLKKIRAELRAFNSKTK